MVNVSQMRCACPSCLCIVNPGDAVEQAGLYYCSDACAGGKGAHHSCGHKGCPC
jgi:hypothetical protein